MCHGDQTLRCIVNAFLINWQPHYFYIFPPFSLLAKCLVYTSPEPSNRPSYSTSPVKKSLVLTSQQCSSTSQWKAATTGLQSIRKSLSQRATLSKAMDIILLSQSTRTPKKYAPYIKKWNDRCSKWNVDSYSPRLNKVLDFARTRIIIHKHNNNSY